MESSHTLDDTMEDEGIDLILSQLPMDEYICEHISSLGSDDGVPSQDSKALTESQQSIDEDEDMIRPKSRIRKIVYSDDEETQSVRSHNSDSNTELVITDIEDISSSPEFRKSSSIGERSPTAAYSSSDCISSTSSTDGESDESNSSWEPPDPHLMRILHASTPIKRSPKKRRRHTLTDDDDEDDTSENEIAYHQDVQHVSIHRILLNKFKYDDCDENIEENVIEKIVSEYNKRHKNNKYVYEKITITPEIEEEDKTYFTREKFKIKVYVQNVGKGIPLLRSYGIKKSTITIHSVIFHYRKGDLFALTTGQAFNLVHNFSDYDFPVRIAARLLSEKGQIESTSKTLLGNKRVSKKVLKEHEKTNPFALLELCTDFVAELRTKASICRLSCFANSKEDPWKGVKIKVCFTSIRIHKRFNVADFLSILHHLSIIARGETTYVYEPGEDNLDVQVEECDTQVHRKSLTRVSKELSKQLDMILSEKIRAYLESMGNPSQGIYVEIDNFDFCHTHMDDFTHATEFELTYDTFHLATFRHHPSFRDVVDALSTCEEIKDKLLIGGLPFYTELNKVKLIFTVNGVDSKGEKLFNFIEGNIEHKDGVYWRVMSTWCSVNNEYLAIIHKQVVDLLQEKLIDRNDAGYLVKPWPTKENIRTLAYANQGSFDIEKHYKDSYRDQLGYWVQNSEDGTLFDMLRYTEKDQLHVYFITSGIDYKTISKGGRIRNFALAIRHKDKNEELFKFYNSNANLDRSFKTEFPTYKKFIDKLNNGTIVYAVANISQVGDRERSLSKESKLKVIITPTDIRNILIFDSNIEKEERIIDMTQVFSKILFNFNVDGGQGEEYLMRILSEGIHNLLNSNEYLQGNDSVTSKFLIANEKTFQLIIRNETNRNIWEKIVRIQKYIYKTIVLSHQSYYKAFWPKPALVKIGKDLRDFDWKLFKICEIPNTPTTPIQSNS